ncbi:MAG: WD40 repeat domain-containing protein, partial [Pirellulales bacterium]
LIDPAHGKVTKTLVAHGPDNRALAISPDGNLLAVAGRDGYIRLWQLPQGELLRDIQADTLRIRTLAFSPDGRELASGGDGRQVRLWHVETGELSRSMPKRPGRTLSLVFCGDNRLASGSSDNLIRLWDLASGGEQLELVGHTGSVSALAWHAERSLLVSGSFDTTVRLWDLSGQPSGKPIRQAAKPK